MTPGLANEVASGINDINHRVVHQSGNADNASVIRTYRVWEGVSTLQILLRRAGSFIFALIDLIVHVTIFDYTIHKNIDESIKLEQLKRELEEK